MTHEPSNADLMSALLDLQRAVTAGFASHDARLESLETRVTSIAGEVKGLQRWMAESDRRFERLERHLL